MENNIKQTILDKIEKSKTLIRLEQAYIDSLNAILVDIEKQANAETHKTINHGN
jgi:hypothetical protein